jgi:hypothetical protein
MDETQRHYTAYSRKRLAQSRASNFAIWVYRHDSIGCEGQHEDLDGLVLPPGHPFWDRFYPPITGTCGCYVVGATFATGARRLGGDSTKRIPGWCGLQT